MIWRAALVVGVVMLALLLVRLWEQRSVRAPRTLGAGLTLVTGADCGLCPQAVAAAAGADVPVRIVDIHDLTDTRIRSIPTALVIDRDGMVVASRSGRSAISGMAELITVARGST